MCKQMQCKETEVGYKMRVLTGVVSQAYNPRQAPPLAMKFILDSPSPGSSPISLIVLSSLGPFNCWTTNCKSNTCLFYEDGGTYVIFVEEFSQEDF